VSRLVTDRYRLPIVAATLTDPITSVSYAEDLPSPLGSRDALRYTDAINAGKPDEPGYRARQTRAISSHVDADHG